MPGGGGGGASNNFLKKVMFCGRNARSALLKWPSISGLEVFPLDLLANLSMGLLWDEY
jgi:hypothetical protein